MNNLLTQARLTFNVRLQLKKEQKVAGIIRNPKLVHRKTGDPFFNVRCIQREIV